MLVRRSALIGALAPFSSPLRRRKVWIRVSSARIDSSSWLISVCSQSAAALRLEAWASRWSSRKALISALAIVCAVSGRGDL